MDLTVHPAERLQGRVHLPGDKSIAHRCVLLASLADGISRLDGLPTGADVASSIDAMRALGVEIEPLEREAVEPRPGGQRSVFVRGVGLRGLDPPAATISCGNSGTTMRLLAGILAGQPFESVLSGDDSLIQRPMIRIAEPLRAMGAAVSTAAGGTAPLRVRGARGHLRCIEYEPPVASAQVKSCVLLAALYASGMSVVREIGATRDHTERLLREMGAPLQVEEGERGAVVRIEPAETLAPIGGTIPGDVSSASYWIVGALLRADSRLRLPGVGINPTRTAVLELLRAWGADSSAESRTEWHGEPVADLEITGCDEPLSGGIVPEDRVPELIDELPLLAVLAPFTRDGVTIRGASELRVKESDRIAAVAAGLRALGAEVTEHDDGLEVAGGTGLRGGEVDAAGDHRIALCFATAALAADGPVTIRGAEVVDVSYPGFFETLDEVAQR